jgi:hypothetical protein
VGEKLRRRVRLEGPPRERERHLPHLSAEVANGVANERLRSVRRAVAERRDVEREIAGAPVHRRHRQVAVAQRVADARIGPAQQLAVDDQVRLERADTGDGLDDAVFAEQRRGATAVDAEHRPVRLLGPIGAGIPAARCVLRELREERVGLDRLLQCELGERHRPRGGFVDPDANEPCFRIGQPVQLHVAPRAIDAARVTPVLAVVRQLDGVARGGRTGAPAQREHAELAGRAVVDRQHRCRTAPIGGLPVGTRAAVDRVRSVVPGQGRGPPWPSPRSAARSPAIRATRDDRSRRCLSLLRCPTR